MGSKAKLKKQKVNIADCTLSLSDEDEVVSISTESDDDLQVSRSLYTSEIDSFLLENRQEDFGTLEGNFKFYDLNCNEVMLLLINPCVLHFYGSFSLKCLAGKADIFGYIVKNDLPEIQVYSCEGSSALYVSTMEQSSDCEDISLDISVISSLGLSLMEATRVFNLVKSGGCILKLGNLEKKEYISNRLGRAEKKFGLKLDTPEKRINNKIIIQPEIKLDLTLGPTVLCGGRGVGKSTSLRYLINRTLNNFEKLLYIDLDIGQPEFTLQECVSAIVVDKPVLGPSYTHFRKPFLSYNVGNIDASRCVETYISAVELLVEQCRLHFPDIPWLVNTMGFNKSVGIYINCSCIAIIKPDLVVQIEGNRAQNFPSDLTHIYVESNCHRNVPEYNIVKTAKVFKNCKESTPVYSNKHIRWLSCECYFNDSFRPSFTLACPIKQLQVFNAISKSIIPVEQYYLLVSKIVVLSSSTSIINPPLALDYAVILSYVESDETFMVLSPLEDYSSVKSILVGSLQIPSRLNNIVNSSTSGLIPYCHLSKTGKIAPTVKPITKTYRFLFEPSLLPRTE